MANKIIVKGVKGRHSKLVRNFVGTCNAKKDNPNKTINTLFTVTFPFQIDHAILFFKYTGRFYLVSHK